MSRLLALITGNPMVLLWVVLGAFAFGGSLAWWAQGLRLTAAEQEFTAYKQAVKEQELRHRAAEDQRRQDAAIEYAAQQGALNHEIEQGIVYRRCVAAGKCGARVLQSTTCSASLRLPAVGGDHGAGADPVPLGRESTTESGEGPPVVSDCAITTLRLNRLQLEIEGQEGY